MMPFPALPLICCSRPLPKNREKRIVCPFHKHTSSDSPLSFFHHPLTWGTACPSGSSSFARSHCFWLYLFLGWWIAFWCLLVVSQPECEAFLVWPALWYQYLTIHHDQYSQGATLCLLMDDLLARIPIMSLMEGGFCPVKVCKANLGHSCVWIFI